jgi:hypothetical protein
MGNPGLLDGLVAFAEYVIDAESNALEIENAQSVFREVQTLALDSLEWPYGFPERSLVKPVSAFAGPHHLASLLIGNMSW